MDKIILFFCCLVILAGCTGVQRIRDRSDAALARVETLGLSNYGLEAQVIEDTATVTGYANSEADREKIIQAIKSDPEVKVVNETITIRSGGGGRNYSSDEMRALRAKILKSISSYQLVGNMDLDIRTDASNTILITGKAPSEALVSRIRTAANEAVEPGQKVTVSIVTPPQPSDTKIRSNIQNALNANIEVNTDKFTTNVNNGVATIRGHFPNHREIDQILSIVLMVEGVKDVKFVDSKK